nr:hypothetical protein [Tanacetum cinerariifolium]
MYDFVNSHQLHFPTTIRIRCHGLIDTNLLKTISIEQWSGAVPYHAQIVAASEAEHYAKMTLEIGVQVQIVGDDLIVTNPKKRIEDVRMSKRIG